MMACIKKSIVGFEFHPLRQHTARINGYLAISDSAPQNAPQYSPRTTSYSGTLPSNLK